MKCNPNEKLRIGLITDSYEPYISGVTASIKLLAKGLREKGHEVYIFTITYKNLTEKQKNDPYIIRFNGFTVPKKGLKMFKRVPFVFRHIKTIKKYNLDVIHIHSTSSLGKLGLKASKRLKIPAVFTAHTMYERYLHFFSRWLPKVFPRTFKWGVKRLMKKYIYNTDITIVPSNKMKDLMLSYGIFKDYIILPTGIDLEDYKKDNYKKEDILQLKQSLNISPNDYIYLYIGRLSLEKNVSFLIDSFKDINREDVKFLIVGDGQDLNLLQNQAQANNITNIIFTGLIPLGQIGIYYQLGDVFLNASQSETQGLTYFEALASGLPVVVRQDRVLEGIVVNDYNGCVYTTKEEFIACCNKVYEDNQFRKKLADNAASSALNYSYQNYAASALKVYQDIKNKK